MILNNNYTEKIQTDHNDAEFPLSMPMRFTHIEFISDTKIIFKAAAKQQATVSESVNEQPNRNSTKIVLLINVLKYFFFRCESRLIVTICHQQNVYMKCVVFMLLLFLFILFDFTFFQCNFGVFYKFIINIQIIVLRREYIVFGFVLLSTKCN